MADSRQVPPSTTVQPDPDTELNTALLWDGGGGVGDGGGGAEVSLPGGGEGSGGGGGEGSGGGGGGDPIDPPPVSETVNCALPEDPHPLHCRSYDTIDHPSAVHVAPFHPSP